MTQYEIAFEALSKISDPSSKKNSAGQLIGIAKAAMDKINNIHSDPATADPGVDFIRSGAEAINQELVSLLQIEISKIKTLILVSATSTYAKAEARKQIDRLQKLLDSVQQI